MRGIEAKWREIRTAPGFLVSEQAMKTIFISSVQKEFAAERAALRDYLRAEPLYLTKYIERMGTGSLDMIRRCREAGLRAPEFRLDDGFALTLRRREYASGNARVPATATPVETQVETQVKTPVKILRLLKKNPQMTLAEAAGEIGKSLSAVERAAAKLVKAGRLSHAGPQKGGHWKVHRE